MNRPLFIGSNLQVAEQLRAAAGDVTMVAMSGVRDANDLARLMSSAPQIVFVEVSEDPSIPLSLASAVSQHYNTAVILISDQGAMLALSAMRAGVRDILSPSAGYQEFTAAISQAAKAAEMTEGGQRVANGKIITVASPKGGVGKTTVATNIAVGLAMLEPESTVIVDLDVQFGDVASALNLIPEFTLPDAARGAASGDALALKTFLTRHETGLYVVAGSDSPAESDTVTAASASALIEMLVKSFKYVVVDTSPGLTDHTLAALDLTNELVLVTSLDVPGIRGLRMELDTLTQLGLLLDARHIVLNFYEPARGLNQSDVEATIGTPVDLTIPVSNSIPLSVNQGVPLTQSRAKDLVTKEMQALVGRIIGQMQDKGRRPGLFGKRG